MARRRKTRKRRITRPHPVYIVLETGSIAGGVRVVFELAKGLHNRGWHIEVLSLSDRFDWYDTDFLRWHRYPNYRELEVALLQRRGYKFATWWNTAETVARCSLPSEGWYLVQDIETSYYYEPIVRQAVMMTYRMPLHKVTTSQWALAQQPDMTWIGNAIDQKFYKRNPKVPIDRKMVLSVMRLQNLKGFTLLAETARRMAHQIPDSRLVTFSAWNPLLLSDKHTHLRLPSDEDILNLYSEAGVFLSTSIHEGFSLTPLEAMAVGVPVVQTNADGNMEYSIHGENCLIASDAVGLVECIEQVMKDDNLRQRLIANGYETARQYAWPDVVDRLEQALLENPL